MGDYLNAAKLGSAPLPSNAPQLISTAHQLVSVGKGLLAMDESSPTCNKRFAALGIAQTVDKRRAWRELIVTTPGLADSISGAILYDETIHQKTTDGTLFIEVLRAAGIIPGIKLDVGAKPLAGCPGEKVTEGLDGLRERLSVYAAMGARFAKWRAVITLGDALPSRSCIDTNAHALARYAALCQEAGMVPIVEPEILMTGTHTLEQCREVTEETLHSVFHHLYIQNVMLEGIILKPNMLLPGLSCPAQKSVDEVAIATLNSFLRVVPAAVAGIAFLSGGQTEQLASARLNAINVLTRSSKSPVPWPLIFSFSRATQQPALELWRGKEAHADIIAAQNMLRHRASCNCAALQGKYSVDMENGHAL